MQECLGRPWEYRSSLHITRVKTYVKIHFYELVIFTMQNFQAYDITLLRVSEESKR